MAVTADLSGKHVQFSVSLFLEVLRVLLYLRDLYKSVETYG
jgi:hypothetical protein